jgi:hypothetical protein
MVASLASGQSRVRCLNFVKGAQWKGSAMPRLAQAIVEDVWEDRDAGGTRTWRDFVMMRGSPIIV